MGLVAMNILKSPTFVLSKKFTHDIGIYPLTKVVCLFYLAYLDLPNYSAPIVHLILSESLWRMYQGCIIMFRPMVQEFFNIEKHCHWKFNKINTRILREIEPYSWYCWKLLNVLGLMKAIFLIVSLFQGNTNWYH